MNGIMSPEAEAQAAAARARRKAKQDQAEAGNTGSVQSSTAESTADANQKAKMSEADLAKLSLAEQQVYYASENLKETKRLRRALAGDTF
jgi:hypothetical protein